MFADENRNSTAPFCCFYTKDTAGTPTIRGKFRFNAHSTPGTLYRSGARRIYGKIPFLIREVKEALLLHIRP